MESNNTDSVTEPPMSAEERERFNDAVAIPIERAIVARNKAKHQPYPDARVRMTQEYRALPEPPFDLLNIKGDDGETKMVASALKLLHQRWTDLREAGMDRDVPIEKLAVLANKAIDTALDPLVRAKNEIVIRLDINAGEIDKIVLAPVTPQLAQDIRHAIAGMVRSGNVAEEIRADKRVASAVLSAPRVVFGVDERTFANWRDIAERAHAPKERAHRDHLLGLHRHAERGAKLAIERLKPALDRWSGAKVKHYLERLEGRE